MFVELHIVQNFAPSNLNRDDTNAPKDCEFGGYRRARISSQCIKRSVRRYFDEHKSELAIEQARAVRSKLLANQLVELLETDGKKREESAPLIEAVIGNQLKVEDGKTSVLLFLGHDEIVRLKDALLSCWGELADVAGAAARKSEEDAKSSSDAKKEGKPKKPKKDSAPELPESVQKAFDVLNQGTHAVDVALFGRMVAELPKLNLNVDAACQVAHAISTNKVDMEMDFFTAVDDLQPKSDTGAGMMGIVEFNSSCFYRYSALDTAQLLKNLGGDAALCKSAILAYVKASIFAIPTGKQNSMAAQNLPLYVRLVAREHGALRSLTNAFLAPVKPSEGADLGLASIRKLEEHNLRLEKMYGSGGTKLNARASLYDGHHDDSIESLLSKLGGLL